MAELLSRLSQRHNEFWDLILGPYSGSGWGVSLLVHALVMTALAFLLITPQSRQQPRVITAMSASGPDSNVGEAVGPIEVIAPQTTPSETAPAFATSGGSFGNLEPDVSALSGRPSGRGTGSGSGDGDSVGADIAGRVKAAGGKGGALQISLAWEDTNDLDLSVQTPAGEELYWGRARTSDGGELDVDMNALGSPAVTRKPVENITWPRQPPGDGTYRVRVHFFGGRPRQPEQPSFRIRLQVGDEVKLLTGRLSQVRQYIEVARFTIEGSRMMSLQTTMQPLEENSTEVRELDAKRLANRERSAREALDEAKATADPALKMGKLRRGKERFAGTEAAAEADQILQQL